MPTFLDGQQNLATLTVPGVYGDIILPTPLLIGLPTNIEALVGVASWGPTNFIVPVSKLTDCYLSLGPPVIRTYDIASYVSASSQVGGSIGYYCVRVTDGTDIAASSPIQTGAASASGTITINDNTLGVGTLVVNGITITWGTTVQVGANLAQSTQNLLTFLQNSANGSLTVMTYALQVTGGVPVTNVIVCTAVTPGTAGNSFTLTNGTSGSHITVSGATLTGGVASGSTCMTVQGKYSGTLGNKIQFSIQSGTLANSYMGIVVFPGMVPEQFNNVPGPVPATEVVTFSANPAPADTLTLAGTAITFVAAGATGNQVNIGVSLAVTLANLMTLLNNSVDANLIKFSQAINGAQNVITLTANQTLSTGAFAGSAGNALTATKSSTAITLSGATFSGGVGTWNTFWINLTNTINSGNAYHAPSSYVTATVGAGASPPVLSSAITLSGGTDGASGVTDATLMGQDIVPRKGMYVLRSSNIDCFTLCDLSTVAYYAAIASFAISETCFAIHASPSGDTIANCLATRINAGIDTPWFKYILGDWPSFYDSYNGQTRLISPAAFALGIYGNLSPQQSALNKPLQGISATQRSTLGQTYSDTELSQINQGGIDTILPPNSSPGGYYFSFATGRNASSNTAANGDEYTRMTNFLIRASQTKAAGSFVGQLQSIQPNDQTRSNAKALFDGFSAQLASSQFGLGLNGQGMIDIPWLVQCDLTNNPPNLQALGYLFLYWQVRYLNVIRYFVIKFQGGGNVTVSIQNTLPTPQQFSSGINQSTFA
jgi:hypothetical protein